MPAVRKIDSERRARTFTEPQSFGSGLVLIGYFDRNIVFNRFFGIPLFAIITG